MLLNILLFFGGAVLAGMIVYFRMQLAWMREKTFLESQIKVQIAQTQSEVELKKQMGQHFEILAQKIFEEKSQKFTDQNFRNLTVILDPLKERIKDFEKKVHDTYSQEQTERGMLRGELGKLMELNQIMSKEAKNLTLALKGESKTQGNWGEIILENILERSGLRKNEEFIVQAADLNLKNSEGKDIRPDIIVNLPDNKHLIVDSKTSLNAYEGYCNAETELDRDRFAKLHIDSLKRHIDGLSEKKYQLADNLVSPDYVILFMPLEPAFALAFRLKPDLFQYAWEKNIAIVSPTTLLTTLRTVAALWKQDRQERNALEIAKRGGLLYEKFVGLITDITTLGKKLDDAQKAHHDVVKKLSDGRGNLMDQVEELKTLGAKTDKSLPLIQ